MNATTTQIKLSDIEPNTNSLRTCDSRTWTKTNIKSPLVLEAFPQYDETNLVYPLDLTNFTNRFIHAIYLAQTQHYPLTLSPDIVWFLIANAFALHVNQNAEKFRSRFVSHDGKKKLEVRPVNFQKGRETNDWSSVFSSFSSQIKSEIGEKNYEMLVLNTTTTGDVEQAVNEIVLMDSMQAYFSYVVYTRGREKAPEQVIPFIKLLGVIFIFFLFFSHF